jgi:hypothetical protein
MPPQASYFVKFAACVLISLAVAGCALTDTFSPRAATYNQEAAQTKSTTILSNIIRAAQDLPLQFTEYTTLTGQANASASAQGSIPFIDGPASLVRTYTLSPSVTAGAQTQVTVQNLNNQEFYYGLQTPVSLPMIAQFIAIGYDPHVVMMLSIQRIKGLSGVRVVTIENDPTKYEKLQSFYDAIRMLVSSGLTFETAPGGIKKIGPVMSAGEAKRFLDPYILGYGKALSAGSATGMPDLTKNPDDSYQLGRNVPAFRVCFQKSKLDSFSRSGGAALLVSNVGARGYVIHTQLSGETADANFDLLVPLSRLCGATIKARPGAEGDIETDWQLELRPVQAIYKYLGRLVQAQLRDPAAYDRNYALELDKSPSFYLFRVNRGYTPGAYVSTSMAGGYSVAPDGNTETDKSTQVLAILTDLWALSSSAKTYSTTTNVSVNAP